MRKLLFLLLLVSGIASAQYTPTSSKTRWINGIGLSSTRDTSLFTSAADTNIITTWNGNIYWKGTGYWNKIGHSTNVGAQIHDSLYAVYQLKAGTSAGARLVSNSGTVVSEWGLGGSANIDFHGFAGYDANRSASYTARSFTDKGYVDSIGTLKQNLLFANVRDYGAVGNGSTDDRAAFVSALASGKPVVVPFGKYLLSSAIQLTNNQQILGYGDSSIVYVNGDYAAFSIKGNGVHIESIRLKGTGRKSTTDYATTQPNQHGIYLNNTTALTSQYYGIVVDKVSFDSLGGGGFYGYFNVSSPATPNVSISNSRAYKCWAGFYTERAEYIALSNYSADSCEYGAYVKAGNVYFSEPMLLKNRTNFYLKKVSNDAHGTVTGGAINHAVKYNIYVDSIGLGYDFTGVNIYAGQIRITQSEGVRFNGGAIAVDSLNISGSTNISFNKSYFYSTPIINTSYGGSASTVTFFEPIWYATAATGTMIRLGSTFYSTAAYSVNRLLGSLDFAHKAYVDSSNSNPNSDLNLNTYNLNMTTGIITLSYLNDRLSLSQYQVRWTDNGNGYYTDLLARNRTANRQVYIQNKSYTLADSAVVVEKAGSTMTGTLNGTDIAMSGKGSFGNSAANYQLNVYKAGAVDSYIQVTSGGGGNGSGNGLLIGVESTGDGKINMQGSQNFKMDIAGVTRWSVNQGTSTQTLSGTIVLSGLGTGTVQSTSGTLSVISDGRLKNKYGYFSNATDAIVKLSKPQYWKYNAKSGLPKAAQKVKQFGLLADDVHKVLGEEFAPTQKDGYYGLSDRALLGLAIQAIQELKAEIELLKKKK